jgi:sigma-B regulation protein RsbQ
MSHQAASEAFYAALLEDDPEQLYERAPCGYLSTTPDGTIVKANATFLALSGYRREELTESFCRTDPDLARRFAAVTFLSDNRADLPGVTTPTLVLQCSEDVIAPPVVGDYVHRSVPGSTLVTLRATGHCPNLSAPDETGDAIAAFLGC